MKRSEAIKMLLVKKTHPDLAAMYDKGMEVQFYVAQDGGERIDEDYKGRHFHSYTDGIEKWSHFRIPRNAKTEPEDNDTDVYTDLYTHAEGIGLTGWDWKNRVSRWVAYDFDAMSGHSDKHAKKMTDVELQELKEIVSAIPWVTIRLSTSGKGIHLYVFLEPIDTKNHTEHAALARAILGLMSSITGFDFQSKVDTCGGNMWIWHRKMVGTNGLALIKQGETLTDVPPNWRDHVRVVSGAGRKTIPAFITENTEANPAVKDLFEEVTGQKTRIPLDGEHKQLVKFLHDTKACAWWDQDHHMLVTHTVHLAEAFEKLGFRGVFKTNAKGENYGADHNCFAYPLRRGAWVVRRYTPGVAEESTWDQDGQGWTRCYFNRELDLATACRAFAGVEHPTGGYIFQEAEVATKAAMLLGINVQLPTWANSRQTKIKSHKDGRVIFSFEKTDNDRPDGLEKWAVERKAWVRIYSSKTAASTELESINHDDSVRHIISSAGSDLGWMLKSEKHWREEPRLHIIDFLKGLGFNADQVKGVVGTAVAKPWQIVCRPFEDEYPKTIAGREWNRKAPQLRFRPTNSDILSYPTWLKILNHCGKSLNDEIKINEWAKSAGILNGADYLKVWLASLFQQPMQPLPYLFFHGPQDSGKSIFHEAVRECLLTSGVVRADTALTNQSGFNGELENAILCVIEETDMKQSKVAYNRIKDLVTAREISMHVKNQTPYDVVNSTHWIQTSNDYTACPIMGGDTRIVVAYVDELQPLEKIPKKMILQALEKEAPDFIAALLNLEIPESNDRLNVPVISTEEKSRVQQATQTQLDLFLEDKCHYVPGETVPYATFYDEFVIWLPPNLINDWPKITVGRKLPRQFPKGRGTNNIVMIGNISFTRPETGIPAKPALICKDDKLVQNNG